MERDVALVRCGHLPERLDAKTVGIVAVMAGQVDRAA